MTPQEKKDMRYIIGVALAVVLVGLLYAAYTWNSP